MGNAQAFFEAAASGDFERMDQMLQGKGKNRPALNAKHPEVSDGPVRRRAESRVLLLLATFLMCTRMQTGLTALMVAAENGHKETVQFLLARGAETGAQDNTGENALMKAARRSHIGVIEVLLRRGTGLNDRDRVRYSVQI